jgi:hypothetical protein
MKQKIQDLILSAAKSAHEKGDLPSAETPTVIFQAILPW